ncbi:MAG: hypothetical protein ACRD2N_25920 [Vicinamibacterales bacterium]
MKTERGPILWTWTTAISFLASRRWRIFLIAWIVYSVHFATNVVREHYPAFSLIERGTFHVDDYLGFHSDIFMHPNGHAVIGNQVLVSTLAAVPLFVFSPVLNALEHHSKAKLAQHGVTDADYRTDKPMRRDFFRLVKERGLDLRFGAATVVTTVFFMAPVTALFLVFFYDVLRERGLEPNTATELSLLLGFGTPLFFRATVLGHNLFVMVSMFAAFVLLWVRPGMPAPVTLRRRLLAGFFGGLTLATDYIGLLILPLLYGCLVIPRLTTASWKVSLRESMAMVVGSLPPILFLLYSQWAMYGNPFLPGQYWMPDQNAYVNVGARGFTLPDADLFWQNLLHPGFGMYSWCPLLMLALVPTVWYRPEYLVLPRPERRFVGLTVVLFLLFCSANQYSRLQFNSGFRYLLPLVPLLFLAISDHWIRMRSWARVGLATTAVIHSWVVVVFREPVWQSWRLFLADGPQLPWYRILGMTSAPGDLWLGNWYVPATILVATMTTAAGIWWYGARLEAVARAPRAGN